MSATIAEVVALSLLLWAAYTSAYLVMTSLARQLASRWRHHQQLRHYRRSAAAELTRIDQDATASVERIRSAFFVAHRLIRDRAEAEHRLVPRELAE